MPSVYIVDDDQELAKAVRMLFRLLRYETTLFSHPRDLAKHMLAADSLPDLLVVDMSMPEVNGMDVVKWIRNSKRFKTLPVIVLSSETHPELVDDVVAAGASAYLFKPTTLEDLEAALKKVLARKDPNPQPPTSNSL
jgi:two-component system chemotaxis response regulator CheY